MTSSTGSDNTPGTAGLIAALGLFVLLGLPLVYVIWETINQVLTGNLAAVRLELFVPAVVAFGVVLFAFMRVLRRWFGDA
jgi:hypothetical protein